MELGSQDSFLSIYSFILRRKYFPSDLSQEVPVDFQDLIKTQYKTISDFFFNFIKQMAAIHLFWFHIQALQDHLQSYQLKWFSLFTFSPAVQELKVMRLYKWFFFYSWVSCKHKCFLAQHIYTTKWSLYVGIPLFLHTSLFEVKEVPIDTGCADSWHSSGW